MFKNTEVMRKMKIWPLIVIELLSILTFSIFMPQVKASGIYVDFENGFGGWQPFTGEGGMVKISTTYAHSGTRSLEQYGRSSGSESKPPLGGIRLPVVSLLDQYELSTWVYVTERSDADASSFFGFAFDSFEEAAPASRLVGWNPWGSSSSYVYVLESEGYQKKGVSYGLPLNTWHLVNVTVYIDYGTVSIWLDGSLLVEQWPAFNAGETPTYYEIECWANTYGNFVMHQYVDDVTASRTVSASLNLTPSSGFASTTVVGFGFSPNAAINITWDDAQIPTVPSSLTTNKYGNFSAIISVPTQSEIGTHTVKAIDEWGNEATATFTVIDMTEPTEGTRGLQLIVNVFTSAASILALCIATIALLRKKT